MRARTLGWRPPGGAAGDDAIISPHYHVTPRVWTYRDRSESGPDKSKRIVVLSSHDRAVPQLLLARGAAADATDPRDNSTAFHIACGYNQPACAEALARAGLGRAVALCDHSSTLYQIR